MGLGSEILSQNSLWSRNYKRPWRSSHSEIRHGCGYRAIFERLSLFIQTSFDPLLSSSFFSCLGGCKVEAFVFRMRSLAWSISTLHSTPTWEAIVLYPRTGLVSSFNLYRMHAATHSCAGILNGQHESSRLPIVSCWKQMWLGFREQKPCWEQC